MIKVLLAMLPLIAYNWASGSFAKAQKLKVNLSSKGNDIAFDVKSIQVPFGEDVTIQFTNAANKDSEIAHNIAVLKPGSTHEVLKFFEESSYNYEKTSKHQSVLAITPNLQPGQSSELLLSKKVLTEPGYYPYICLVPGHADILGMKGLLFVKKPGTPPTNSN